MSRWRDVKKGNVASFDKRTVSNISSTFKTTAISSRFKAFTIDSFLISTPIFYIVIYLVTGSLQEFATQRVYGWSLILGSNFLVIGLFWYIKAQTPGLKAYSLKLISNNQKNITIFQVILRYLATFFSIITIFILFLPFFRKDRRTFQDIVSSTYIVEE